MNLRLANKMFAIFFKIYKALECFPLMLFYCGDKDLVALAQANNLYAIKLAVMLGADVNRRDKFGNTALTWAAHKRYTELLDYLLDVDDIDVNQDDKLGYTALIHAAKAGDAETVKFLLNNAKDIDVNQDDIWGATALIHAAKAGDAETVELLLNNAKDIDVNQEDELGATALICAATNGYTKIVKFLLNNAKDIDVNQSDNFGCTALRWAVLEGRTETVQLLLNKKDIDVNKAGTDGNTALTAAIARHPAAIKLLLGHGANPQIPLPTELKTEIKNLILTAQIIWNEFLGQGLTNEALTFKNGDYLNYEPDTKEYLKEGIGKIISKPLNWKYFYQYPFSVAEAEFMQQKYYDKAGLNKFLDLADLADIHIFKRLNRDVSYEILRHLTIIGDMENLYIVATVECHRAMKANKATPNTMPLIEYKNPPETTSLIEREVGPAAEYNQAESLPQKSLLPSQVEYFLGSILAKPMIKCTVSYLNNAYQGLNFGHSYSECLQHGYLSKEGLLENLSAPFLITMTSLFLNVCGWPSIGNYDSYKFLEYVTAEISSPFIKGVISTAALESLPLVGEVIVDGAQYVKDSIYCSFIDCTGYYQ